jgi:glycosyltransferase involved in cell wall biosynthesis
MLRSRCLAFPSKVYESQPLVIVEALAAGLGPIASDHPPIRYLLDGLDPAALVGPSVDDWVEAISWFESDDNVDIHGVHSRQLYLDRFTPAHKGAQLESVYAEAIAAHGGDN